MKKVNYGRDIIYLKGSRMSVWRNVYGIDGKFYIKLYGEMVEVRRSTSGCGWATVEAF